MQFVCSKKEEVEIKALAEVHGISNISEFMRQACLGWIQVDRNKIENKKKK
jgi:hypothetical protein